MLTDKDKEILERISKDKEVEKIFFQTVKNLKWFFPLKNKGYFSADNAPQEEKVGDYARFPEWVVLPYLKRVAEQLTSPGHEDYAKELIKIIEEVLLSPESICHVAWRI